MLQILCSSVRVKLLARAKLIFLREQPDDFFSVGNPVVYRGMLVNLLKGLAQAKIIKKSVILFRVLNMTI